MKNYFVFLLLLCTVTLASCKKEKITAVPAPPSFILLTKIDDSTFHPGESVTIKWKTTGYPVGAVINATILHIETNVGGGYENLAVDQTVKTSINPGTPNDGEAVYTFPSYGDPFYSFAGIPFGYNFQIVFYVEYLLSDGTWYRDEKRSVQTNYFIIVPDGCTTNTGSSTTTGKSCTTQQ